MTGTLSDHGGGFVARAVPDHGGGLTARAMHDHELDGVGGS
ncbi:hypothetical protein [Nonomuraea sp. NPDC003804]